MHTSSEQAHSVLLKDRTHEEIIEAAERWFALQRVAAVQVAYSEGFDPQDQQDNPGRRHLLVSFKTHTNKPQDEVTEFLRDSAVSKLTDLADLMRADALETHLEGETHD